MSAPRIELLYSDGGGGPEPTATLLRTVCDALAPESVQQLTLVPDMDRARELAFFGSPTIRIDGVDIVDGAAQSVGLGRRTYDGADVPPRWRLEAALLRALAPRFYLFLCVANSARSQLAEGIARSMAADGVTVASAGSAPTGVRPEAIAVLRELGLDITDHRCKAIDDIPPESVEAVITLCADEVCPAWLGRAHRVHWGLPDPAAVDGAGRLDAFRAARDELRRRLSVLFGQPSG